MADTDETDDERFRVRVYNHIMEPVEPWLYWVAVGILEAGGDDYEIVYCDGEMLIHPEPDWSEREIGKFEAGVREIARMPLWAIVLWGAAGVIATTGTPNQIGYVTSLVALVLGAGLLMASSHGLDAPRIRAVAEGGGGADD